MTMYKKQIEMSLDLGCTVRGKVNSVDQATPVIETEEEDNGLDVNLDDPFSLDPAALCLEAFVRVDEMVQLRQPQPAYSPVL